MAEDPDAAPDGAPDAPSAPELPDAAPDQVQDLLNGVFGAISDGAKGVGEVASDLAGAIGDALGGGSSEEAFVFALDVAADVSYALVGAL